MRFISHSAVVEISPTKTNNFIRNTESLFVIAIYVVHPVLKWL
nr:hypothetical protein [Mycoplasmopsis bovis]